MHSNITSSVYCNYFKRSFDLLLSLIAFIFALPIFIPVTLILLYQNKGRPFFFQSRPGLNEKEFSVVKFKTMTDVKDQKGKLLPDHQRTTITGRFLRNYSLDELPQLINVIKGDMSLVGPRPLLFKYIPLYSHEQRKRHLVRPGITGWAQINGRNTISWNQKFEYDLYYINHLNLWFDIKILWVTALKVIKSEGVNSSESVPMPPFNGSN